MNTSIHRRSSVYVMLLGLVAACGVSDRDAALEPVGSLEIPLETAGESGAAYRLSPANFQITGVGYDEVFDGGAIDVLRVNLFPGQYEITLQDGWVLSRLDGSVETPVEAVLQSPNPQAFDINAGAITDVVFRFGVGDDAVAFGQGKARVRIEVDDCDESAVEICNGVDDDCDGEIDNSPECIDEICDNAVDDDGDGDIDCADPACAAVFPCTVPAVGTTGNLGVAAGSDWQVCRADASSAWLSGGNGGGTYDADQICQSFGYSGADLHGGNCNTVCGYCGTPGQEQYDNAGAGFPDAYRTTVHWRCTRGFVPPPVGLTGNDGVAVGANWQVCRADASSAWISAGLDGGTYSATAICAALGYADVGEHGGNCNTVCGYCGTPGQEEYDNAGTGWPSEFRTTVNWRCVNP